MLGEARSAIQGDLPAPSKRCWIPWPKSWRHRFASSGFLTAFSKALYTSGYDKNPFSFLFDNKSKHKIGDGRHEIDRYNDLIESITNKTIAKPKLYPTFKQFSKIEPYVSQAFVCMAPSSVWFTKQLPKDKWIELCNTIPKDIIIYLLGFLY